jgi:fructose-1,6-bisphosphatase/inositol monophosphatase family enzyme/ADP-ribosylglycohydrolase
VNLSQALDTALDAARIGGEILRSDFHRPGGAKGVEDKAEADLRAETAIRRALLTAFPHHSYLGEETGAASGQEGAPLWLVDPNDGTLDYLKGRRGSAVSIALLEHRRPVLGVVFAFAYPDDRGDVFAWAVGMEGPQRNGKVVSTTPPSLLGADDVVLLSRVAERDVDGSLAAVAPARYRSVPSIAHRLALVACGEAQATVSLYAPGAWDYGAGHALVRSVGGVVVNEAGAEVTYGPDGASKTERAFAGSAPVVAALVGRGWDPISRSTDGPFVRIGPGESIDDPGLLSRAQGCLLGEMGGASLGAQVGSLLPADIARTFPGGPRLLVSTPEHLAGQPTEEAELGLVLARSLIGRGIYDPEEAATAYRAWYRTGPTDLDPTTRAALVGYFVGESQSSGSLVRIPPLAVFAHALPRERVAALGREDSALTHPSPACRDAGAALAVAIAHVIANGVGARAAYEAARGWAEAAPADRRVVEALRGAAQEPVPRDAHEQGACGALQNAFFEALRAPSLEAGLVATVQRGGEAARSAAVAGALLGALHGRDAVPAQWRSMVLSCRAHTARARHPRPPSGWAVDLLEIAEGLVLAGRARG